MLPELTGPGFVVGKHPYKGMDLRDRKQVMLGSTT
jgi:hypothetical protein